MNYCINIENTGLETEEQAREVARILGAKGYDVEYTAGTGLVNQYQECPCSDAEWKAAVAAAKKARPVYPLYTVVADQESGEWLDTPEALGQVVDQLEWLRKRDTPIDRFTTYDAPVAADPWGDAPPETETRAIIVRKQRYLATHPRQLSSEQQDELASLAARHSHYRVTFGAPERGQHGAMLSFHGTPENVNKEVLAEFRRICGSPAGRKPMPAEEALTERTEIRMTKAQRAKYEELGGAAWVRQQIDAA